MNVGILGPGRRVPQRDARRLKAIEARLGINDLRGYLQRATSLGFCTERPTQPDGTEHEDRHDGASDRRTTSTCHRGAHWGPGHVLCRVVRHGPYPGGETSKVLHDNSLYDNVVVRPCCVAVKYHDSRGAGAG